MKRTSMFTLLLITLRCFSQSMTCAGTISDSETGLPLPFVHVLQGNTLLAVSDINGGFSLQVNLNDTINFSCVGFKPIAIIIEKGHSELPQMIRLQPTTLLLDEVTVSPKFNKAKELGHTRIKNINGGFSFPGLKYFAFAHGFTLKKAPYQIDYVSLLTRYNIPPENWHKNPVFSFVKVRISENNEGFPGKDLVDKNMVFTLPEVSGWVDFDLGPYDVVLDNKEIFVIIEFLGPPSEKTDGILLRTPWLHLENVGHTTFSKRIDGEETDHVDEWGRYSGINSCIVMKLKINY